MQGAQKKQKKSIKRVQRNRSIMPSSWRRPNPPSINPNPWNPLTLEFNYTGLTPGNHGTLTVSQVSQTLVEQTSINVNENTWFLLRFLFCSAWEMEGNGLEITINDLDQLQKDSGNQQDFTALSTRSDLPARNSWAHAALIWPQDQRNNVFETKDEAAQQIIYLKSNNDEGTSKIRLYLRILWRTTQQSTPGRVLRGPDTKLTANGINDASGKVRKWDNEPSSQGGKINQSTLRLDAGRRNKGMKKESCCTRQTEGNNERPTSWYDDSLPDSLPGLSDEEDTLY